MQEVSIALEGPSRPVPSRFITPRVLDRLEQIGIVVLWIWLCWRLLGSPNEHAWLAIVSETTILIFVIIRRRTEAISYRISDWLLAMVGSLAPALVSLSGQPIPGLIWLAVTMVISGDLFQIWAKLTLARSFGIAPANRGVKTDGPYKIVRHPMYTGYCVSQLGVLMVIPSIFNLMLFVSICSVQLLRLKREESLLGDDSAYREMMSRVRWRIFPGIY